MFVSTVQTLLPLIILGAVWRYVLRPLFFKSALENLPGPPVESFLTGNLNRFWSRHAFDFHYDVVQKYGPVVNMKGWFSKPVLYVYDSKALHSIVIKDQYVYEESAMFLHGNQMYFGPSLLSTMGDHHRKQRKQLNPVFSMAHMRYMTPIFYEVAGRLRSALATRVANEPREIDMLDWSGRTALELVGQGALGYSFDPLTENVSNEYANALKDLLPGVFSLGVFQMAIGYVTRIGSATFRRWIVELLPSRRIRRVMNAVDTMHRNSLNIYNAKKIALESGDKDVSKQIGAGKDLLSILIKANMETKSDEERLPEEELIAQISTITFAATDTTSNTLAKILELLSQHQDVQEKLRAELLQAQAQSREKGEEFIPYDALMQLPYLDAICRETLRRFAPVLILERVPRQDIMLPLSQPIRGVDGQMMSEVPITKGTPIFIGVAGINWNEALWGKDVLEWKPERWLSSLPTAVTDARVPGVYSNLMTFLGGGRACIGFKFSELEMKVVLATLISQFKFELTNKPIFWNIAGVNYPTMDKDSVRPEMLLNVSLLKTAA